MKRAVIPFILFGLAVLLAANIHKPPLAKADLEPFPSFASRYHWNAWQLEKMRAALPEAARNYQPSGTTKDDMTHD